MVWGWNKIKKEKGDLEIMKRLVKGNKVLATILSLVVVMSVAIPANAASADVNIEVKATTMDNVSVTVPTTLPIMFNEDGTNTLPSNWTIENISSIAGIHLSTVDMDAKTSGWKLLAASADTKVLPADTKSIKFSTGKAGALKLVAPTTGTESTTGTVSFGDTEIAIPSGETQVLAFDVQRGAFTADQATAKAFDMVLTFNFN